MTLYIPIGIPGSGKSTLGAEYFKPTEIVNPDTIREWITGDMRDQSANTEVYEIAHRVVRERLSRGLDTYFDATNLDPARWPHAHRDEIVVIQMSTITHICYERNRNRDRVVPEHVMDRMLNQFYKLTEELDPKYTIIDSEMFYRKRG